MAGLLRCEQKGNWFDKMAWLLYSFPGLVNYILGGMMFITAYRFSEADAPGWVVGASLAMWSAVYLLSSLGLMRFITPGNAARLIFGGGVLMAAASFGFIVVDGLYAQFIWIFLSGVANAVFCTPYQVFIRSIGAGSSAGIMTASAKYTASWSFGYAVGPFLFGLLSPVLAFSINTVLSLVVAGGIWYIARSRRGVTPAGTGETAEQTPVLPETGDGGLIWFSWIVGLTGVIANMIVRCLVPYRGATLLSLPKMDIALVMAAWAVMIGITALILQFFPRCSYRRSMLAGMSLLGAASLILFGVSSSTMGFVAASTAFGIYCGYFYYIFVFHAMAHPTRSRNCLGINEVLVGLSGTVGPLVGGWISTPQTSGRTFIGVAAMVLLAGAVGLLIMMRHRRRLMAVQAVGE